MIMAHIMDKIYPVEIIELVETIDYWTKKKPKIFQLDDLEEYGATISIVEFMDFRSIDNVLIISDNHNPLSAYSIEVRVSRFFDGEDYKTKADLLLREERGGRSISGKQKTLAPRYTTIASVISDEFDLYKNPVNRLFLSIHHGKKIGAKDYACVERT